MNMGEIIKDALKYPLLEWKRFLTFGILILICNILINGMIVPDLVIIGYIIGVLILGYVFKIIKFSLNEATDIPKFNAWSEMFSDGLKVLLVSIVYFIPAILIIIIPATVFSVSAVIGTLLGVFDIPPIDSFYSISALAGLWFLIAILYLVIIVPIMLISIVNMADNNSKLNSAFKFHNIFNNISTSGWKNFIAWYLITGLLALIIFGIGTLVMYLTSFIFSMIGIVLVSLTFTPYIYMFISRSVVLFYKNTKLQISRKYFGLILILIIGVLVLSFLAINPSNNNSDNIKVYNATTNTYTEYGVSFNYPSNWDVYTDNNDGHEITAVNNNYTLNTNSLHDDSPQFQIQISTNPPLMSEQDAINSIQNLDTPSGWQIITNKTIILDGNTAYETIYTINDSTQFTVTMTDQQITFVKNGNTYFLDFQAPANDFNNEQTNFNTILNTLKIQ